MDILQLVRPRTTVVEPETTIVAHADGLTAISRRWAEGVLNADPYCSRCKSRGEVSCLTMVRGVVDDAALFTGCKAMVRAGRVGRTS